jgi:uncharacterized protein (PEP-CTERM system associated)
MRSPSRVARRGDLLAGVGLACLAACPAVLIAQPARAQSAGAASSASSNASSGASSGGAAAGDVDAQGYDSNNNYVGPPTPAAPIGTMLPPLAADPTSPALRSDLLNAFGQQPTPPPGAAVAGPAWQIMPQVTVAEEYTNNPGLVGGPSSFNLPALHGGASQASGSDFVTLITPQIIVIENGERLRVNLFYAPTGEIFAENTNFSQFRQQFNGDVLGTIMPSLLYMDVRGSVFQQPVYGGLGEVNTTTLPPNQRETISNISASPYVVRSFGGLGTLQAGVGYIYTDTAAPAYLNQQPISIGIPDTYGSSWLADKRIYGSFTTGEDFGRFQNALNNDSNFYTGSGPLRNGQRVLVTDDVSYAINRFVAGLGEIGYENLHYPNEGFSYVGGVWSAGARITPNAVSTITLEYRYVDGFYSPYVYGSWQLTPRLRLFGGYSEGITSFDQDQQNGLLSGNPTATGAAASALIAAPLLNNGAYSGSNQGLNHDRRLNATAAYLIARDTVTATFNWDRETIVGNPAEVSSSTLQALNISPFTIAYVLKYGLPPDPLYYFTPLQLTALQSLLGFNKTTSQTTNNLVGGLSWHHELQPTLSSDIYAGYTRSRQEGTALSTSEAAQLSVGLTQNFTSTLSGRIGYAGNYFLGGGNSIYTQNDQTVTLSITKKF